MIRLAAAGFVALCLSPSWLCAQSTTFTVSTASADVYKSPSTGGQVIGKAPRGSVLEITRELGSWVKVSWPDAQDGVGYLHVSMGSIAHSPMPRANVAVEGAPARPEPESVSLLTPGVHAERPAASRQPASSMHETYIAPPTHLVGLGGLVGGSRRGFGGTARVWSRDQFGIQLELSRYALTSTAAPGQVTSIQFAPSLLYSLHDRITDYVWIRPYFGAGASVLRQTLSGVTSSAGDSVSDTSLGLQVLGGSELTFASVPRFALSANVGYRWSRTPFAGFEPGALSVSLSGHWYIK